LVDLPHPSNLPSLSLNPYRGKTSTYRKEPIGGKQAPIGLVWALLRKALKVADYHNVTVIKIEKLKEQTS
jgi:hypothetical protein